MSLTTPTVGSTPLRHTPSKRTLRTPTPIDSSYLSVSDSRKRQSKKDEVCISKKLHNPPLSTNLLIMRKIIHRIFAKGSKRI